MDVYEQAGLYRDAFRWSVDAEVEWLLGQAPGVRAVLEPMCGDARYGPAFAARGVRYCGIDISSAMLAGAPRLEGVEVMRADARAFAVPGRFELAWCAVGSIRHLVSDRDVVAHLEVVRGHLAPGGVYVVELELVRRDGVWSGGADAKSEWAMDAPDGSVVQARWCPVRHDLATRRVWERATLRRLRGGLVVEEVSHVYELRMMAWGDWEALVARAGLSVSAVYEHRSGAERPQVEPGSWLENTGFNYYFVLRCPTPADSGAEAIRSWRDL